MEKRKQIHIRVPDDLYKKLRVKCVYEDVSITDYIFNLIVLSLQQPTEEGSVLIVEDEAVLRESLEAWLKDSYKVTTAVTGEEALELIKKQEFDVLVIDVRLPGKNAIQVLREAKEMKPHIQSIIMTAYPVVDMAVEAMKLGAVDYLVKPFAPDKLERLIWRTITKSKSEQ